MVLAVLSSSKASRNRWFMSKQTDIQVSEEASESNIQVASMKNGHFSSQSPFWNYTIHPWGMALLLYHQINTKKAQRDCRLQTKCSGVAWHHEVLCWKVWKSCKKQALYKTACGRIWTVNSSNEALKLPFPFFCSHSCVICKLHSFGAHFLHYFKTFLFHPPHLKLSWVGAHQKAVDCIDVFLVVAQPLREELTTS